MLDIQPILDATLAAVETCRLGEAGLYRRYCDPVPGSPEAERSPMGCASAANLLYTLGLFPAHPQGRNAWIHHLRSMQDEATGLYHAPDADPVLTTAQSIAALELFDLRPHHAPKALLRYLSVELLHSFLDELDWRARPEEVGARAAGLYTSLILTEQAGPAWEQAFFAWLDAEVDEETGFLRRGCVQAVHRWDQDTLFPHLAGHVNLLFTYVAARRPHPLPWRVIDTCLGIMEDNPDIFCRGLGAMELAWVFSMTRSRRITAHRHEEVEQVLRRFAPQFVSSLKDCAQAGWFNDLYALTGSIAALAELQNSVPGLLKSRRPLRQALDRRPFV